MIDEKAASNGGIGMGWMVCMKCKVHLLVHEHGFRYLCSGNDYHDLLYSQIKLEIELYSSFNPLLRNLCQFRIFTNIQFNNRTV
jgi:hypothetical protein